MLTAFVVQTQINQFVAFYFGCSANGLSSKGAVDEWMETRKTIKEIKRQKCRIGFGLKT